MMAQMSCQIHSSATPHPHATVRKNQCQKTQTLAKAHQRQRWLPHDSPTQKIRRALLSMMDLSAAANR